MAQSVKHTVKHTVKRKPLSAVAVAGSLALLVWMPLVQAQALPDPTRPANQSDWNSGMTATSGPVLQSVLISPQRKIAIISGQAVSVGEKFGGATLIRISEGSVVLRSDNKLQTLKLFPDIEKRVTPSRVQGDLHSSKTKR
jgi:MSHA biogenesis protein MshK